MSLTKKEIFFCLLNGFLIGIANLIPGVSGGTFALILGLYDRLLNAVTSLDLQFAKAFLQLFVSKLSKEARLAFQKELLRIDFYFLVLIGVGLLISVVTGARLIQFLLQVYPTPTLALFVGLILPSLAVPYKLMERHTIPDWLWLIPGIGLTIVPSLFMGDSTGSENPFIAFITGMIAISAMILPGISGSYIMLVLGEYQIVISKLTNVFALDSILFLGGFALGCLVGLILFTHLVKWLFEHHKPKTMAFLIGLILGSFYILWPFKDFSQSQSITGRKGEIKRDIQIATAKNTMPENSEVAMQAGFALIGGIALGYSLGKLEELQETDSK